MRRMRIRKRPVSAAVAMAVVLSLSACGGGGGSNIRPTTSASPPPAPAPAPAPAPPPPPQPPLDAQLSLTNTYAAHDAGFTGAGVTIGVVDTGINHLNPTVQGRVTNLPAYLDPSTNDLTKDDVVGHGTWVSEIAAGQPYGQFPGGIAPGANLVGARIISDTPPKDDGSGQGNAVQPSDADFFANYLNPDLINAGVQVMNNSWGGLYWDPSNADQVGKAFAAAYRPFVIDHGGIVVFATGNDGNAKVGHPEPSDTAALPYWGPDLERGWIAAAALDSNHPTQLAEYSNKCGKAMNYCISAPGNVIVLDAAATSSTNSPDYYIVEGTSFATPEVSGAAALVWQAFPYFDNDMVRQTILGTATDLGAAGVDPMFGWGALNVGKAVKGPANFAWGDVSVSFDGITSTWSNDIVGAGGLSKDGSGTLVLAGHDTYQGDTQVLGGALQTAFTLPGNATVASGATLTGMYDVGAGDVPVGLPGVQGNLSNAGVVLVAGGNAEVGGNYIQASSGSLSISLGSRLDVAGTANIDGNLNIVGKDAGYVTNSHENLLTAAGGVTGTFATFTLSSGVFLSSTVQYDVNDVWIDTTSLSVTTTAASAGFGAQPAVMGSAQRVDGAFQQVNASLSGGGTVANGFIRAAGAIQHTQTLSAAQLSLQSLSGELHAVSAAMAFQSIDATSRTLSDRFDHLVEKGGYGMWTQQLDLSGSMARSGFDGVGFQLNGWLVGSDRRIGQHGVAGFAFGQSQGDQRLQQRADRDRSRDTEGMLYAGWMRGDWYTQGRVGFGHIRQNVSRQLLLGANWMPVSTHYNGQYQVAYGESGLHLRQGRNRLIPYVNVQYAQIRRDGFAEQGAYGFGLQSPTQTLSRWQAGVGLRAAHHVDFAGGPSVDFTARVQWQRTLASSGDVFDASFVGVQDWRPLVGIGLSRYSGLFGVGMNAHLSPKATLKFGYDYQLGQRIKSKQLMARFRLAF